MIDPKKKGCRINMGNGSSRQSLQNDQVEKMISDSSTSKSEPVSRKETPPSFRLQRFNAKSPRKAHLRPIGSEVMAIYEEEDRLAKCIIDDIQGLWINIICFLIY